MLTEKEVQQIHAMSREELIEMVMIQDQLLEGRESLLNEIPECPEHGQCIPFAVDWIKQARQTTN